MGKKLYMSLLLLGFLISGCKPSVSVVETAMARTQEAEEARLRKVFGYWSGSVKVTFSQSDLVYDYITSIFIHENCPGTTVCLDDLTWWGKDNQWLGMQYASADGSGTQACFITSNREFQACLSPRANEELEYSLTGPDFTSTGILYRRSQAMTPQPPDAKIELPDLLISDWNARIFRQSDLQGNNPIYVRFKIAKKCPGLEGYCLHLIPLSRVDDLESAIYPLTTVIYNQYCFGDGDDSFCFLISVDGSVIYDCKKQGWIGHERIEKFTSDQIVSPPPVDIVSCVGALESQLSRGAYAYMVSGLGSNNLRNSPGLNSSIEGKFQPGAVIQILDGPVCTDSYTWWRVLAIDTGNVGWTAENSPEEYFVLPCQSASCKPAAQATVGSDKCDPVGFLQYYFDIIEKGNLKRSYKLLSDRFIQKHHPDGYQPYLKWWSTLQKIELLSVEVVSSTDKKAVLSTEPIFYFKNGQIDGDDIIEYTIAWDSPDGSCMMDDEVLITGSK